MKLWSSWIGWLVFAIAASSAAGQSPILSSLQAPYPAVQSQVNMAGNTYGPGAVTYGPVGTPLVLLGSGFGDHGAVWFIAYKNRAVDTNSQPVQAIVTSWTPSQVSFKVPPGAVTGLVEVVVGDKASNGLPFIVTQGIYSGSCPVGPSASQLRITTDSLQDGTANQSYSTQLKAVGGSNSYTWSLASGSLPAGLSLSSSGVISGTPTSASNQVSFTVQVTDNSSSQQRAEAILSLEVAAQPEDPSSAALYSFSIQTPSGSKGYDPAGNVIGYTDSVNGIWSFNYDSLNRLATAAGSQDDNPYPNYCWQYDSFGNRLWQTSSATSYSSSNGGANSCPAGSGPSWWAQYTTSNTNRMDSTSFNANQSQNYDAAGNIGYDGVNSYLYDGEGRICAVQQSVAGLTTMMQYLYDAEGRRVAKGTISNFSCDTTSNGFTATSVYVFGPNGEQMTEMTSSSGGWQWAHTNISAAGQQIATYDADPTGATEGSLYFHLSDWLGTRRQQTDYAGNPTINFTGLPYGDGLTTVPVSTTNIADATEHHFTGKELDAESGNDYFGARYYSSSMGRFMSPDWDKEPSPVPYAYLQNPQTLNLYSYVLNNPLNATDPDGHTHQECDPDKSSTATDANGNTTVTVTAGACHDVPDWWNVWTNFQNWRQSFVNNWMQRIAANQKYALPDNQLDKDIYGTLVQAMSFFSTLGGVDITRSGSRFPNKDTGMTQAEFGQKLESEGFTKGQTSDGSVQYNRSGPNGKEEITMYPQRTSTGGPGGQVKENGVITGKLSFKP